ncbi:GNAT family N-acetyltransferase [Rhodovulum sp. YEN HP10]|uniref:GNAT family N-acetyltransferase n=1 Tax=Rhodovulum sp. HP10 TaxID=3387397 RepID=UPI0039E0D285
MALRIALADLSDPAIRSLLATHAAFCESTSPPESCHFLPLEGLDVPEVTVWAAWDGAEIAGIGALKALSPEAGEIKSMHTAAACRGQGVGAALLAAIQTEALKRDYRALWLETGTAAAFAAARALYEGQGFEPCGPFGTYRIDPHSAYYTKRLARQEAGL